MNLKMTKTTQRHPLVDQDSSITHKKRPPHDIRESSNHQRIIIISKRLLVHLSSNKLKIYLSLKAKYEEYIGSILT